MQYPLDALGIIFIVSVELNSMEIFCWYKSMGKYYKVSVELNSMEIN